MKRHLAWLVILTFGASAATALAQVKQLGPNATPQEFISGLKPASGAPPLKFRGLRVLSANPSDQAANTRGPSVAVDIDFALNSAVLTDQAKALLKRMAAAMNSNQLASYHFLLEGHTDTTGRADYNLALSKRRAQAVLAYLTHQLDVASSRLQAVGRGEKGLLDPDHPTSPLNRRVQVVNMGE